MSEIPTPWTDNKAFYCAIDDEGAYEVVFANDARVLEHQLAAEKARANHHRDLGITLLDAKWLDPECHKGCQSLVLKAKLDAALAQVATLREALELVKGATALHAGCGHVYEAVVAALSSNPNTKHPDTERLDWLDALNANKGVLEATYFANRDAIDAARKEIAP